MSRSNYIRGLRHSPLVFLQDTTNNISTIVCNSVRGVLHSVGPFSAAVGDIIDVRYQFEATNDTANNLGLARGVYIASSATATTGTTILREVVENITPDQHHQSPTASMLYQVTSTITNQYINLVVAGLSTSFPTSEISFETDYGNLTVAVV